MSEIETELSGWFDRAYAWVKGHQMTVIVAEAIIILLLLLFKH